MHDVERIELKVMMFIDYMDRRADSLVRARVSTLVVTTLLSESAGSIVIPARPTIL